MGGKLLGGELLYAHRYANVLQPKFPSRCPERETFRRVIPLPFPFVMFVPFVVTHHSSGQ